MKKTEKSIPFDQTSDEPCPFQTADSQVALEWCAVLASQKIDFDLKREGEVWLFSPASAKFAAAEKNINDYENERDFFIRHQQEFATPPAPLKILKALPFIVCGFFLYLFFIITGPADAKSEILNRGILSPEAFFKKGEWWRTITSLTLHADYSHLMGNVLFLCLFATVAASQAGVGASLFFIFASGVLGNLSTITLLGEHSYNSLGASTAVFGALGIISILSLLRRKQGQSFLRHSILPLVSGMALLAFTGTSPGSDVTAHLFGFFWGIIFGIILNGLKNQRQNIIVQSIYFASTFLIIFYAWSLAAK